MAAGKGKRRMGQETGGTASSPGGDPFETVINSISDGLFAVDLNWRITCFNDAAERTTGRSREDVLGRPCSEVLRSNICEEACALRSTRETGRPIVNLPVQIRDARGNSIPLTISTALLRDASGQVIGGVETFRDLRMVRELFQQADTLEGFAGIITQDPVLTSILQTLPTVARSDSTVLLEGESGTGKGLMARALHQHSTRKDGPLVEINCGALPDQLLESELFGYKAGAFTGANRDKPGRVTAAERGTLFLDEICDLPLLLQVKLLRVLEERLYEPLGDVRSVSADVRIVAATNQNLLELVEKGRFRRDVYYRLSVIRLEIPPLRRRPADIPLLAGAFLRRLSMNRGKVVERVSDAVMERLIAYEFPGNVRELHNLLEHAYVMTSEPRIELGDLPPWFLDRCPAGVPHRKRGLQDAEARAVLETLARNGWNRREAARDLEIHKSTLYRKIRRLGIELPPREVRSGKKRTTNRT